MRKLMLLAAFGAGYVLGARAGRQRYEQIADAAQRVAGNPRVQAAKDRAVETASAQAAAAAEVAKEKATDAASTIADKARREASVQPAP